MFYVSADVLVVKCELGWGKIWGIYMDGGDGRDVGICCLGCCGDGRGCLNRGLRRCSRMGSDGGEKGKLLWKEIFSRLEMVGGVVGLGVRLIGCDG